MSYFQSKMASQESRFRTLKVVFIVTDVLLDSRDGALPGEFQTLTRWLTRPEWNLGVFGRLTHQPNTVLQHSPCSLRE
jgi:hypothetical protein